MILPQTPYNFVKVYGLPVNGASYRFYTLVSLDEIVMWMPDTGTTTY